jgi:septal ring factor EnvC (AmiA/AmiB activator)
MHLSALRSELAAITAHGLTPSNVEAVEFDGASVRLLSADPDANRLADACEDLERSEAACKAAEAERDAFEAELSRVKEMRFNRADLLAELDRFQTTLRNYSERFSAMQAELGALRKRKGVPAGVCAYAQEVHSLLCYVAHDDGRNGERARELLGKINSV